MSREKTKKLLDSLKEITGKKDRFATKPTPSSTNTIWKSSIETGISSLPKSYDKDKWIIDKQDEDRDSFKYIDRVYGGLFGYQRLEQKDGTEYKGKLYNKRRILKGADGNNFYSPCTVTADGRWFDNGGFPIEPPKKLDIEPEPKKTPEEIEEEKEEKLARERRMLENLK